MSVEARCAGRSALLTSVDGRCSVRPKFQAGDRHACGLHIGWLLGQLGEGETVAVTRVLR